MRRNKVVVLMDEYKVPARAWSYSDRTHHVFILNPKTKRTLTFKSIEKLTVFLKQLPKPEALEEPVFKADEQVKPSGFSFKSKVDSDES